MSKDTTTPEDQKDTNQNAAQEGAQDTQPQESQQVSGLKLLIIKGKEQGYLTYTEVNDHLPDSIVDPEQIEEIVTMIGDMGIKVFEKAPDEDSLILTEEAVDTDDEAAAEKNLAKVKKYSKNAFVINVTLYMGCMH
ncbi:MAG: hypothetical protein DSZ12_07250 [Sulfurovum sp.]|nr:MAG: hypothetical protein DSZ12_07250 [Sulfurovum sp.]